MSINNFRQFPCFPVIIPITIQRIIVSVSLGLFLLNPAGCRKPYDIRFDEEIHDFGQAESGEDIEYEFVFTNSGTRTLVIEQVRAACPCTKVHDWDTEVAPGEKGKIPVTFTMENYNGDVTKAIFVKTKVPGKESIRLTLKGHVIIPIEIVPLNTWLGEITRETKQLSHSFEIRNNMERSLEIIEIIPPDIPVDYKLVTIKEHRIYRLDYTITPPFKGSGKTSRRFILKTNIKDREYIYPQFNYLIQ